MGEALCKQAINKRNRSRIRQLDTSVERRALGEIQNVGEGSSAAQGAWQSSESSQSNLGEQAQSGPQGGRSQRRERHNRMERDRRYVCGWWSGRRAQFSRTVLREGRSRGHADFVLLMC